jgi:hypothetical protein
VLALKYGAKAIFTVRCMPPSHVPRPTPLPFPPQAAPPPPGPPGQADRPPPHTTPPPPRGMSTIGPYAMRSEAESGHGVGRRRSRWRTPSRRWTRW